MIRKCVSSFFMDDKKLHAIPLKHITTSVVGINMGTSNFPRILHASSSDSREKCFRTIYSLIKGEIILAEGFNTSLQHAVFDRGKSSCENIMLLRILMNASDNVLACLISSSSARNIATLEPFITNSLAHYGERELNLLQNHILFHLLHYLQLVIILLLSFKEMQQIRKLLEQIMLVVYPLKSYH